MSKEEARKARYAHLKVGDVIQVLTNLGWEKVIVRRKLENGKLDIVFQDGETMLQVMPRILDKRQRSNSIGGGASGNSSNVNQNNNTSGVVIGN